MLFIPSYDFQPLARILWYENKRILSLIEFGSNMAAILLSFNSLRIDFKSRVISLS